MRELRERTFRKPPLYIFPDMERQLKLRPQKDNTFFTNGISSQMPVAWPQAYEAMNDRRAVKALIRVGTE